jgi:hypothetical protein
VSYERIKKAEAAFQEAFGVTPYITESAELSGDGEHIFSARFEDSPVVTFQALHKLAEGLGTDHINLGVTEHQPGRRWSSVTYESSIPARFVVEFWYDE